MTTREVKIPAAVRTPFLPAKEQGYTRTSLIATRPEDARAVMDAEFKRIEGHVKRARELAWKFGLSVEFETRLAALLVKESAVA